MNADRGLTKELEISEPWPQSKILWCPRADDSVEPERDLLATSSDFLRLYEIYPSNEEDGLYRQDRDPISLVN